MQVVATLVSEIVLCVKEVNQKTRAAAYGLLVDLGQAMHEADPPSLPSLDTHMGGLDLQGSASTWHQQFYMFLYWERLNAGPSLSLLMWRYQESLQGTDLCMVTCSKSSHQEPR